MGAHPVCLCIVGSSNPPPRVWVGAYPACLCIVGSSNPPPGVWVGPHPLSLCIVGSSDPSQETWVGPHPICLCIVGAGDPSQGARVEARALREARGEDAAHHSAERREDRRVRREQRQVRERVRRGHRGVRWPQWVHPQLGLVYTDRQLQCCDAASNKLKIAQIKLLKFLNAPSELCQKWAVTPSDRIWLKSWRRCH